MSGLVKFIDRSGLTHCWNNYTRDGHDQKESAAVLNWANTSFSGIGLNAEIILVTNHCHVCTIKKIFSKYLTTITYQQNLNIVLLHAIRVPKINK